MKQKLYGLFAIAFILLNFYGCRDTYTETFEANVPIYTSIDDWRAQEVVVSAPRELNEPGKIYIYESYLFVVDHGTGVHIIENSNPSSPQNLGFINILGCSDVSVRNDVLYTDSYFDLLTFSMANPTEPQLSCRVENVFDSNIIPTGVGYDPSLPIFGLDDSQGVIIGWNIEEITQDAEPFAGRFADDDLEFVAANSSPGNSVGIGGSLAQFAIVEDYLYVLKPSSITAFDLSGGDCSLPSNEVSISWEAETIFPYNDHLFIGTRTGMMIYGLQSPSSPDFVGSIAHLTVCDPVVVQDDRAYVTLRTGTTCFGSINQLDVIDISDYANPTLINSYDMSNPFGLGIDETTLFICDGWDGLKVFNAEDDNAIDDNILAHYAGIQAYDVIPFEDNLILSAEEGIYQYDYSDPQNIISLSFLPAN